MYKRLFITTFATLFVYSSFAIKDNYIFKFKDGVDTTEALKYLEDNSVDSKGEKVGRLKHKYQREVLNGFAGELKPGLLKQFQKKYADVIDYFEEDGIVTAIATQTTTLWNLPRISSRTRGSTTYIYNDEAGLGVKVYVLDTGIFATHPELLGRVEPGFNALNAGSTDTTDRNGHGTHCAGIIGSTTYGVAKKVSLVPVKVLDDTGSGTYSSVIAGINYVATKRVTGKTVISMSLGGPKSKSLNDALYNIFLKGVPSFVAAGNSNADACKFSPSSAKGVMAVGSTNSIDNRSYFSNYGTCVAIYAPGESITSTWSDGGVKTISGTSMACPHVAGVAALFLSKVAINTPTQLYDAIKSRATTLPLGKFVYNQY